MPPYEAYSATSTSKHGPSVAGGVGDVGGGGGGPVSGGDDWQNSLPAEFFQYVERDRRYKCPVEGCNKKYKQLNGVQYHYHFAHQKAANRPNSSPPVVL